MGKNVENQTIIYEQPVNELMRICLRLEHCFQQIHHFLPIDDVWAARCITASFVEILAILDRPDLKTKFTQEIQRMYESFAKLQDSPGVDASMLNHILSDIESLKSQLSGISSKFAPELREDKFLDGIKQNLDYQASPYSFDIPAYHYWLSHSYEQRSEKIQAWLTSVAFVESMVNTILSFIRKSNYLHPKQANNGFFEQSLDSTVTWQLIRIALAPEIACLPRISVGRHRLCISFMHPNTEIKIEPFEENFDFQLSCCAI